MEDEAKKREKDKSKGKAGNFFGRFIIGLVDFFIPHSGTEFLGKAVIIACLFFVGRCTINGYSARAHFKKGYEYYVDDNYEAALKEWEKGSLKKNTPSDSGVRYDKDGNLEYPDLGSIAMWWYKVTAYRKVGEDAKANELEAKIYQIFKKAYPSDKDTLYKDFPRVYNEIENCNAAKAEKQIQQQQYNEFLADLSKCKQVDSHWLEYYGESGVTYKIAAVPVWADNNAYWIEDGKSEKILGGIQLSCSSSSLKDTFKDLAYTKTPAFFYITYSKYGKSELVYINY